MATCLFTCICALTPDKDFFFKKRELPYVRTFYPTFVRGLTKIFRGERVK